MGDDSDEPLRGARDSNPPQTPIFTLRRFEAMQQFFPQLSQSDSVVRVKGTAFPCGVWGKAPIVARISLHISCFSFCMGNDILSVKD